MTIPPLLLALALGVSAALGALIAWLVCSRRGAVVDARLASIRERNEEFTRENQRLEAELDKGERRLAEAGARHAELNGRLEAEREAAREKQALLRRAEEQLADTFRALSTKALESSNAQFLQLAKEALKSQQSEANEELEKRRRHFEKLAKPIENNLLKVETRIGEIEKARATAYTELRTQITGLGESQLRLQKETSQLVKALRQPTGRGQWGELQLQKVVEMAGMQEHCDFSVQTSSTDDEGKRLRPDLVINLPGGKTVVVDSKTPMDAYLDAIEAEDEDERRTQLIRHARQIRTHIDQLASKKYSEQFDSSPEFIVLFLPSEAFFSSALNIEPGLIERGVENGVILATPTTLIALLRAVAYGWRQESLERNAREIARLGHELHSRLATLSEHFARLGKSLDTATKHYNKALGSYESRVLSTARRFETLEASSGHQSLESLPAVETAPRLPLNTDPIKEADGPVAD